MTPGTSFGKYELVSRIAKGGMAETFRARLTGEAGVTKNVVIKKMIGALSEDEGFIAAFISEARLSAGFNHPNIAQIFDFGEEGGEYFLAMELVDGRSLAEVLARAAEKAMPKLPEPIACFIAIETLKALHYAHTRVGDDGRPLQIVHRDVSPDKVLVSFEGDIKVVDFGVATAVLRGRLQTQAGVVKGKYLYFSPEQAEGGALDGRSDVFATSILLYRMLCGVLPFEGQQHVAVAKILRGDYRPPRVLSPGLSPALAAIVTQGLQCERAARFESALKMQEALSTELFRNDHAFSSETLKEFVGWLFDEELAQAGAPSRSSKRLKAVLARSAKQLEPVGAAPRAKGLSMPLKIAVAIGGGLLGILAADWSTQDPPAPAGRKLLVPVTIAAPAPGPPPAADPGEGAAPQLVRRIHALPATVAMNREHRVAFDPQYLATAARGQWVTIESKRRARVGLALASSVTPIALRQTTSQYVPVPLSDPQRFDAATRLAFVAPILDGMPAWEAPQQPQKGNRLKLRPLVRRLEEHEGLWATDLKRESLYRVELTSKQTGLLALAVGKPEMRNGMPEVLIHVDGAWKPAAQTWAVPSRHDVSGVTTLWFGILSLSSDPELTLTLTDLGPRPGANKDPLFRYAPEARPYFLPSTSPFRPDRAR